MLVAYQTVGLCRGFSITLLKLNKKPIVRGIQTQNFAIFILKLHHLSQLTIGPVLSVQILKINASRSVPRTKD